MTCERVYFLNCPQAFATDSQSNGCGLFDCYIWYNNFSANDAGTVVPTMISFNGAEEYIDKCVIAQQKPSDTEDPGPTGCIGVIVNAAGAGYYITDTHISDFQTGIQVFQGSNLTRLFCTNVSCESWTNALVVTQPNPTTKGMIVQVYCSDCLFERSGGSTDETGSGVVIGADGGESSAIGEIFLNNCSCFGWPVAGLLVNAGEDIVVTGGRYGSNAFAEESTSGGITIAGGANVTINGADLSPLVLSPDSPTQSYALAVTAAVSGLYVHGCNMEGYGTSGPLYLSSAGTQIEITDCAGYNDRNFAVATTVPGSSTFSGATLGYYGPVTFYGTGSSGVTVIISGHAAPFANGTFTLAPGQSVTLIVGVTGHAWTGFLMIGQ